MTATTFVLRLLRSHGRDVPPTEFRVEGNTALVGRDLTCDVPLDDAGVSRRHALIEWTGQGQFRVVDLGSVNGVWVGERRIAEERLESGQQFRVGESVLECRAEPAAQRSDAARTRVIARAAAPAMAERRGLADAGELVEISDRSATLLDDPASAYYVVAGQIDVFTVTIEDGRALEGRSHFATVKAGEAIFGMEPGLSHGSLLLAIGTPGVEVLRRIAFDEIEALARQPELAATVAAMVDGWLLSAASRLMSDLPEPPEVSVALKSGVASALERGQRARASDGVLWIPIERDTASFMGIATLAPVDAPLFFPLTPHTWIEPAPSIERALAIDPRETAALMASGRLWASLRFSQETLCASIGVARRRSAVAESARLDHKARQAEVARNIAFDVLADVLADSASDRSPAAKASGQLAPILEACRLVGGTFGLEVKAPADLPGERTFQDHVAAIATASAFRTRVVVLRGAWWETDAGPLLGHTEQGAAVALLPRGPRAYVCVDIGAGTELPVTPASAAVLAPFAFTFYRPLPTGTPSAIDLMRFGARGLASDLRMLLGIGLLVGALGAVIPLLTGQMIDRAIPQAERGLLIQLGVGMLLVTLASVVLSIVKSVAIVRVESRIDHVLQSAVWVRLLALPAGFFREYGAGDLAERASGIDAIRHLLSSSGIGAILGVVNAVAYLALMLYLSAALTLVAVAVTLVLVAFSTIANYLLLRTQRQEVELRGHIASLVLQLIAGVGKVRMSGAENHAFRVWALRFAEQKRLSFGLGHLQNVATTLGSGFQVLAPLAIFAAIHSMQSADAAAPPALTTGGFVAFYAAFGTFTGAMSDICAASLSLLAIVPYYERLKPILSAAPESDGTKPQPGRLEGEVSVSRLHFRYRADGPWVLKDVSLSIRPGEFVALVGPSGCGKSTLLRLLLGFEQPGSGTVCYDGLDLTQLDARALRQQLGVVLQESRLMPTDIFRNIVGDSSRTINEAWQAAEQAGLADDIRRMPMGLNTVVSEGGGTFSGGQSQRLLIARALVARPRIVFFDEATSALDNKTQAVVTASLDRLEATRVVIAHRLSTLVDADRIIYLDEGQIQEEGTYAELMAKGGRFAKLAQRQLA